MINNNEFLDVIFGEDKPYAHVTDFVYDPSHIPADKSLIAWVGDYFKNYRFKPQSNQYFTVSTFDADETGRARRRISLFKKTYCVVLDDVKEKLSFEAAQKLPTPTWIMETSPGSEQWGYVLDVPCTDRHKIDNLHDGLVQSDLAPRGTDPGQKGVTRYVRLPEGWNLKEAKFINGQPFKCVITQWNPFDRVSLEDLAAPFGIDLNKSRMDKRIDGAADIPDHPLLNTVLNVKEVRSDGRFDITCPWVDEHTNSIDSGSAIFTNKDGTLGFKCHHGACESRTGKDLLREIERQEPGFNQRLKDWQFKLAFKDVVIEKKTEEFNLDSAIDDLSRLLPNDPSRRGQAEQLLKLTFKLSTIDQLHHQERIRTILTLGRADFKKLKEAIADKKEQELDFFSDDVFINESNSFYNRRTRNFYSPDAYQNVYQHLNPEAKKLALGGKCVKVDKFDFAPGLPAVFVEENITYVNCWTPNNIKGVEGDISIWLNHFDTLGWGKSRDHVLQWMAHTILKPEQKINHILLMGSAEGCGKDWLFDPLIAAMGNSSTTIPGDELLAPYNNYLIGTKHLHINEVSLGNRAEAAHVADRLKPLATSPPKKLRLNDKFVKNLNVRNVVNCSMGVNSRVPVRLEGQSRRFYALWSDFNPRNQDGTMKDNIRKFWNEAWEWMNNGGREAVIFHLRNHVDISKFNPGTPPPMTEFLNDIVESSKNPMQVAIESLSDRELGCFKSDLVKTADVVGSLAVAPMIAADITYLDPRYITPSRVESFMYMIPEFTRIGDYWCVRNALLYQNLTQEQLLHKYFDMVPAAKAAPVNKVFR